jgi:hypothetical protein
MEVEGLAEPMKMRFVFVPYWSLASLFGVLPGVWVLSAWRQRKRYAAGHCPACGYDLRASPGRCPECGAVPAVKGAVG